MAIYSEDEDPNIKTWEDGLKTNPSPLTVKELKEVLNKLPDDMKVTIEHRDGSVGTIVDAETVCIIEDDGEIEDQLVIIGEV